MTDNYRYRADFLWEHEDGSIEEAGYEFANGKTEDYVRQWWEELLLRVRESDQQAISQQRQTIDALTAALESLLDWTDGYSSLPDNYIRRNARSVLDALEKARGESDDPSPAKSEQELMGYTHEQEFGE